MEFKSLRVLGLGQKNVDTTPMHDRGTLSEGQMLVDTLRSA